MTVAGCLMAHHKRDAFVAELMQQVDLPVVWDTQNDRHHTGLCCLKAGLDSDATHWLIVQDDALVCRDLIAGLERATAVSGDRILGLYAGHASSKMRTLQQAALAAGTPWVERVGAETLWGVALVIPTVHLPSLIASYEASREQNYDRRIERWADRNKVPIWYTAPSLVDHRVGEENPSLVPGRTSPNRHAAQFLGEDRSALDLAWEQLPLASLSIIVGHWRHPKTGRVQRATPGSTSAQRLQRGGWEPVEPKVCDACGSRHFVAVDPATSPMAVPA